MTVSAENHLIQQTQALERAPKGLPCDETTITATRLSTGDYHILSRFGDTKWILPDTMFVHNHPEHAKALDFKKIPIQFQPISKVICLKYYLNGREGSIKPRGSTIVTFFKNAYLFLQYLCELGVRFLGDVTELMCSTYVQVCAEATNPITGKRLSCNTLNMKLSAVEALFELSQNTFDPMRHPWSDTSSAFLSGIETGAKNKSTTLIIPENIVSHVFSSAVENINHADALLTLRDKIDKTRKQYEGYVDSVICEKINRILKIQNHSGLQSFNAKLNRLLDSCIIVILITSGIRIHELASLKVGCGFTTIDDEGEVYYWMSGRSEKTHEGNASWLVTEITHAAIKIATRLIEPLRVKLLHNINNVAKTAQADKLLHHTASLFLSQKKSHIQTLSSASIRERMNKFSKFYGLDWHFTPHQFRRTFAVYAAHSAFGDLRYLKEHFKHWSLDMTALYALNEQQDTELYDEIMLEIKNEKISIVEHWLDEDTPITGGMAKQVIAFRNKHEAVKTYKSRRLLAENISEQVHIRATTVAWCTADNGGCPGGEMVEKTRCSGCDNAVIDDRKKIIWQGIYKQQIELKEIRDIGPAGKARIVRDIERCEHVLKELGVDLSDNGKIKK